MSAAAAMSVAFSFNCHKPITSNHSRGRNLLSSEDRTGPIREHGKLLAQAHSAGHTVEALQSIVAPFARLDHIAATAWTRDTSGPAHLSQVIGSFLVILQIRYQVFHQVAPMGVEQPHYTDTAWVKLL
jgi:hypothetical protein